ncbi:MAG: histidine kinase N-terminal 7TM domain-containing protein [Chloroflexota bacterium]
MQGQYLQYILPLLLAAVISATLSLYAWQRRTTPGASAFLALMLGVVVYALGYALELGSAQLAAKIFWAKVEYLGIVTLPLAWLAFALQYTGRSHWLTRRHSILLVIIPLATIGFVWSNESHHLIWQQIRLDASGPFVTLDLDYGAWFWIHSTYSYLLLLFGTGWLMRLLWRWPQLYRQQFAALLAGVLAPWIGNGLYLSGHSPLPHLDLTPFAFTLSGLSFAWGLLRFRLLDIVPVARQAVVDSIRDGVLVLDSQNRIVDINPAARQIIGPAANQAIGRPAGEVLSHYAALVDRYRHVSQAQTEIALEIGGKVNHFELFISPLIDPHHQSLGRILVLHDITARKQAEETLRGQKQLFESLVAIGRATTEQPTLEATLQNALAVAANLTGAENSTLFLIDEKGVVTHSLQTRSDNTSTPSQDYIQQIMEKGLAGWVARHRQGVLIYDVHHDPRWLPVPDHQSEKIASALSIPIVSGAVALGVLTLGHSAPDHFKAEHLRLMQAAVDQMALAVRNAQIFEAQRRLADRQIILYEIVQAVAGQTDPDQVLRVAADTITEFTGWQGVVFALPVEDPPGWTVHTIGGTFAALAGLKFERGEDAISLAFKTAQTQPGAGINLLSQPDHTAYSLPGCTCAVPLRRDRRVIGVFGLHHKQPHSLDTDEVLLAESLAEAIALAYDNARLHAETRQRLKAQTALQEASAIIASSLDLTTVLNYLAEQLGQGVGVTSTYIYGFEPKTMTGTVLAEYRGPQAGELELTSDLGATFSLPGDGGDLIYPARTGQPILKHLDDPQLAEGYRRQMAKFGTKTALIIPLQIRDQTIALAELRESRQRRDFTAEEIGLCQSIVQQAAIAIEKARLFDDERRHATGLSALYTVTRMANQSLVLEDVLAQVLSAVLTLLGFKAGVVTLVDPLTGKLYLAAERGLPSVLAADFRQQGVDCSLCHYVLTHQEPLIIEDLGRQSPVDASRLIRFGCRAYVGVPLLHRGQTLGTLSLFSHSPEAVVTLNQALITTIGHQIATAVANARLFQTIATERSQLQALIESSRDGIILIGLDRRLLITNAPMLRLLGLSGRPEDWTERPITAALARLRRHAPAAVKAILAEMRRMQQGNEPAGEGEFQVANRTIHWLSLPVLTGATPLGRLIVLHDVTEERLLAKMRDDLTHTMVHDLRNPLTAISSALQLIEMIDQNLSTDQRRLLGVATNRTEKMMELVNGILEVSQLESGRMPIECKTVPISGIVDQTLQTQSLLAEKKNLTLESKVAATLPPVWADPKLLERVLQNLVGNAIKFTPAGGSVHITAGLVSKNRGEAENSNSQNIEISVADNGPGIAPEIKNQLFQKFVTGRQEESGSGLGLAFCKLAVEAHGGQIWVQSNPDQGATFTFTLPLDPKSHLKFTV